MIRLKRDGEQHTAIGAWQHEQEAHNEDNNTCTMKINKESTPLIHPNFPQPKIPFIVTLITFLSLFPPALLTFYPPPLFPKTSLLLFWFTYTTIPTLFLIYGFTLTLFCSHTENSAANNNSSNRQIHYKVLSELWGGYAITRLIYWVLYERQGMLQGIAGMIGIESIFGINMNHHYINEEWSRTGLLISWGIGSFIMNVIIVFPVLYQIILKKSGLGYYGKWTLLGVLWILSAVRARFMGEIENEFKWLFFKFVSFIPFRLDLIVFGMGVLLGGLYLDYWEKERLRIRNSCSRWDWIGDVVSFISGVLSLTWIVLNVNVFVDGIGETPFVERWAYTGLLTPIFGCILWAGCSIEERIRWKCKQDKNSDSVDSALYRGYETGAFHYRTGASPSSVTRFLESQWRNIVSLIYPAYLCLVLVWNMMSSVCSAAHRNYPQFYHRYHRPVCMAITGAAANRNITIEKVVHGPHPILFFGALFVVATVFRDAVHVPLRRLLAKLWRWRRRREQIRKVLAATNVQRYSSFETNNHRKSALGINQHQQMAKSLSLWERKKLSNIQISVRLVLYYATMLMFLYVYWKLSVPIFHLAKVRRNPVLCIFLPVAKVCNKTKKILDLHDTSHTVNLFFSFLQWISFLSLPAMLVNVLGHVAFPRVLWKPLPSIATIFKRSTASRTVPDGGDLEANFSKSASALVAMSSTSDCPPSSSASIESASANSCDTCETADNSPLLTTMRTKKKGARNVDRPFPVTKRYDTNFVLYVRYVTRGTNPRLMAANVLHSAKVLEQSGLPPFSYVIEVVTDSPLPSVPTEYSTCEIRTMVVPISYNPPNGAKFKARALTYAIQESDARDFDWIVHLDEETRFDGEAVCAIVEHCAAENYKARVIKSQQFPCIGQGPIVYGRQMECGLAVDETGDENGTSVNGKCVNAGFAVGNWITTLADSYRVADDCGRFRVQYECGEAWVGMHGSFVVVANIVEKLVTFDHGIDGSIAEDAYFALLARSRNVRFAWIDALMYEQSPFTFVDFIRQRSRWLVGGLKVCASPEIPWKQRLIMGVPTTLWAMMPFSYCAMLVVLSFGGGDPADNYMYYHVLLPVMAAVSSWCYVLGFWVSYRVERLGVVRYCVLFYMQVILTLLFGVLEVSAVCYALWNFASLSVGFHVIQKEGEVHDNTDVRGDAAVK